jgi:hypothetical protein
VPHTEFIGKDGKVWPSVTTILGNSPKPWLDSWYKKWGALADRKTKAATDIGSDFHLGVEAFCDETAYVPKSQRVAMMLDKFARWADTSGLEVIEKELHVVSREHRYHGSFDAIGYLKDKPRTLVLFDWKTSKGIKPEAKLQLAAYAQAYYEEHGRWIHRGVIVNVLKQKPHHAIEVQEYPITKHLVKKFLKKVKAYYEQQRG